jgi:hypothetical protein
MCRLFVVVLHFLVYVECRRLHVYNEDIVYRAWVQYTKRHLYIITVKDDGTFWRRPFYYLIDDSGEPIDEKDVKNLETAYIIIECAKTTGDGSYNNGLVGMKFLNPKQSEVINVVHHARSPGKKRRTDRNPCTCDSLGRVCFTKDCECKRAGKPCLEDCHKSDENHMTCRSKSQHKKRKLAEADTRAAAAAAAARAAATDPADFPRLPRTQDSVEGGEHMHVEDVADVTDVADSVEGGEHVEASNVEDDAAIALAVSQEFDDGIDESDEEEIIRPHRRPRPILTPPPPVTAEDELNRLTPDL